MTINLDKVYQLAANELSQIRLIMLQQRNEIMLWQLATPYLSFRYVQLMWTEWRANRLIKKIEKQLAKIQGFINVSYINSLA